MRGNRLNSCDLDRTWRNTVGGITSESIPLNSDISLDSPNDESILEAGSARHFIPGGTEVSLNIRVATSETNLVRDADWKRVHPFTSLVDSWAVIAALLLVLGSQL